MNFTLSFQTQVTWPYYYTAPTHPTGLTFNISQESGLMAPFLQFLNLLPTVCNENHLVLLFCFSLAVNNFLQRPFPNVEEENSGTKYIAAQSNLSAKG